MVTRLTAGRFDISITIFIIFLCNLLTTASILDDTLSTLPLDRYSLSILDINDIQTSKFVDDAISSSLETVTTKSRSGQTFVCYLPATKELSTTANKSEVSSKIRITNEEVSQRLKALTATSSDGSTPACPQVNQGWWTYEFCFGTQIMQFHAEPREKNGQSTSNGPGFVSLSLGHFSHETVWDNQTFDMNALKKQKNGHYHSQYYNNGSKCELTGHAREAQVKFYCAPQLKISITEPSTCRYVIVVNTPTLCDLAVFKKAEEKEQQFEKISCVPQVALVNKKERESIEDETAQNIETKESGEMTEQAAGSETNMPQRLKNTQVTRELDHESVTATLKSEETEPLVTQPKEMDIGKMINTEEVQRGLAKSRIVLDPNAEEREHIQDMLEGNLFKNDPELKALREGSFFDEIGGMGNGLEESKINMKADQASSRKDVAKDITDAKRSEDQTAFEKDRKHEEFKRMKELELEGQNILIELKKVRIMTELYEEKVKAAGQELERRLESQETPPEFLTSAVLAVKLAQRGIEVFKKTDYVRDFEDALIRDKMRGEVGKSLDLGRHGITAITFHYEELQDYLLSFQRLISMVDIHASILPPNAEIDQMSFEELKAAFDKLTFSFELEISKEHPVAQLIKQYEGLKVQVADGTKDNVDISKEIIVKALRVAMKQSKGFFTELAEAKLLKIQNLQNYQNMKSNDPLGQSSLGLDSMTKLKNLKLKNKGNGMWKRWDQTTPKLSSLEQYKNVMLGRGGKSGTVTKRVFHNVKGTGSAKTFLKVKLTQLSKVVEMDDDNIELPTDELSIELDTDELMGGDTVAGADVQDMEVHLLAVGSSEEYKNLMQDPEQLISIIKNALKSGQTMMVEGDPMTSRNAIQTQMEHSNLANRYWDPTQRSTSASGPLFPAAKTSSQSSSEQENDNSRSEYSRNYHLV